MELRPWLGRGLMIDINSQNHYFITKIVKNTGKGISLDYYPRNRIRHPRHSLHVPPAGR
jgi:hypothetical protein